MSSDSITFPPLLLLLAPPLAACGTSSAHPKQTPPPPGSVAVSVSPASANIRAGSTYMFTATVTGSSNTAVSWSVNSTPSGSSTLGTIDSSGNYTAPAALPSPNTVSVTATSAADSTKSSSSAVTLLNPTPVLTGISPATTNLGNYTLTVAGSNFVSGAQVLLGSSALSTTLVSSTQLTATGTASSAGVYSITVQNPAPGSSASSSLNFQVNGSQQTSNCSQMSVGQGASLSGFLPSPSDNL
jgi:hypothetical protein